MMATFSQFHTVAYSNKDATMLPYCDKPYDERLGYQHVICERRLADVKSDSIGHIRSKVLEICKEHHPTPITVRLTPSLNRPFLLGKQYHFGDPDATYEILIFKQNTSKNKRLILSKSSNSTNGKIEQIARIIGRDHHLISLHLKYFVKLYRQLGPLCSDANIIHDAILDFSKAR
ncbi:MAG: hypothetical protein ACREBU_19950 [Nitrososphaera sp.]